MGVVSSCSRGPWISRGDGIAALNERRALPPQLIQNATVRGRDLSNASEMRAAELRLYCFHSVPLHRDRTGRITILVLRLPPMKESFDFAEIKSAVPPMVAA